MKKLSIIFLLSSSFIFADTTFVSGSVNGTWTAAGSPYIVTNNLIIQPSDTLNIDPGVNVLFAGEYRMDVFGLLKANGANDNHITFASTDAGSFRWHSLNFSDESNDSSSLNYCSFQNGSESGYEPYHGMINCNNSSPTISNSTFNDHNKRGIHLKNSNSLISGNFFRNKFSDGHSQARIYADGGSPKMSFGAK